MLTLALETSTPHGSLALVEDDHLVVTEAFQALRGHNSKIYGPLETVLAQLHGRTLDRIVVGTGPGSYTGARIAIAIGNALALCHNAALIGYSSLCAASLGAEHQRYWLVGDARRDQWYRAEIHDGRLKGQTVCEDRRTWEAAIQGALDEGIAVLSFDAKTPHSGALLDHPTAERLIAVSQHVEPTDTPVEPAYLAPAFITTPRKAGKGVPR